MAVVLALGAAVVYGAGDFLGGVATRRVPPVAVVLVSHSAGLVAIVAVLAVHSGGEYTTGALGWGALSGLAGGVGVALLYRALAGGTMSVVAPITALLAAIVPVLGGVVAGEQPPALASIGIAVALGAIFLITRDGDVGADHGGDLAPATVRLLAVGAGLAFGVFFLLLAGAGDDAGLWPILGTRLASVSMFAVVAAAMRTTLRYPRAHVYPIVAAGLLDMAANTLYLLATQRGLVAIVAVLTSLYPASTIALAQVVLHERLERPQVAGLGLAALAATLIAVA
jgi:uncharacterized membrane protein